MNPKTLIMIQEETRAAAVKHPPSKDGIGVSWERAALILTEECGEVVRAVLDMTRNNPARKYSPTDVKKLRGELVQVASVSIRLLDRMEDEEEVEKKKLQEAGQGKGSVTSGVSQS